MAHRHVDGALPAGRAIADQFGRHERWGRLVKQHGTGRAADTTHLGAWLPHAEEAGRHPSRHGVSGKGTAVPAVQLAARPRLPRHVRFTTRPAETSRTQTLLYRLMPVTYRGFVGPDNSAPVREHREARTARPVLSGVRCHKE
jgi:hypothetical protein